MRDIIDITTDLVILDSQIGKGANVLSVQLGSLEYLPNFGIDFAYFLTDQFQFQNESFKAYILQRLAESSVDVATVTEQVEALYTQYDLNLAGTTETNPGLVG